jgi:hypothetical protein
MHMDGWADHLHISFYGEHALFPGLRLTSLGTFITAAALALLICFAERYVWSSLCHQVQATQWCTTTTQCLDLRAIAALGPHPRHPSVVRTHRPLARSALCLGDPLATVSPFPSTRSPLSVPQQATHRRHAAPQRRLYMLLSMTNHAW